MTARKGRDEARVVKVIGELVADAAIPRFEHEGAATFGVGVAAKRLEVDLVRPEPGELGTDGGVPPGVYWLRIRSSARVAFPRLRFRVLSPVPPLMSGSAITSPTGKSLPRHYTFLDSSMRHDVDVREARLSFSGPRPAGSSFEGVVRLSPAGLDAALEAIRRAIPPETAARVVVGGRVRRVLEVRPDPAVVDPELEAAE